MVHTSPTLHPRQEPPTTIVHSTHSSSSNNSSNSTSPHSLPGNAVNRLGGQIVCPPVVQNPATPPRTKIQLLQGPNIQLQVRGLLPGQQLIKLPDGCLQHRNLPTVKKTQAKQPAQASSSVRLRTLRPAISWAPPQSATVATSTSAAPSTAMSLSRLAMASISAKGISQLGQGQATQIKAKQGVKRKAVTITPSTIPKAEPVIVSSPAQPSQPAAAKVAKVSLRRESGRPIKKPSKDLPLGGQIVRPPVVQYPATPVSAKLQFIQGPNNQYKVRGLLPGKQLISLPDGSLQLRNLPTVKKTQAKQPAQASSSVRLPTLRPAISFAPTQSTTTAGVATLTSAAPMSISRPAVTSVAAKVTIQLGQCQATQIKVCNSNTSSKLSTTSGALSDILQQVQGIFPDRLVLEALKKIGDKTFTLQEICEDILQLQTQENRNGPAISGVKKPEVNQVGSEIMKSKTNDGLSSDDVLTCTVCMDRQRNAVFLPCGHFVSCWNCSNLLSNCPVCRRSVTSKIRTYVS